MMHLLVQQVVRQRVASIFWHAALLFALNAWAPKPQARASSLKSSTLVAGECETDPSQLALFKKAAEDGAIPKRIVTIPMTYALTAGGYVVDATVGVTAASATALVICAPYIALYYALFRASHEAVGFLICPSSPIKSDSLLFTRVGESTYNSTRPLRCADYTPFSRATRNLATCYLAKNSESALNRAHELLFTLKYTKDVYECVSEAERQEIDRMWEEIPQSAR